jgi:hypothetical protein
MSVKLPRGWQLGGRFRLVSGLPFTPVVGGVQYAGGAFLPLYGSVQLVALPAVSPARPARRQAVDPQARQRDRVPRRAERLQPAEHRGVPVQLRLPQIRSFRRSGAVGLPIFPSIGVRVDF